MATFWDQYHRLEQQARTPQERGRLFERFLLAFLSENHYPGAQFLWVKPYSDWIADTYPGRSTVDQGIDLVALDTDHHLWAIQSKDHQTPVDWPELSTFISLATSPGFSFSKLLVVAVGGVSRRAEEHCRERGIAVWTGEDFDQADVDWDRFYWDKPHEIVRITPVELRPYQEEAVSSILAGWEEYDRGKCIMPPGTGKTLVALRTVERVAKLGDFVLFCAPSIALVNQTIRAWKRDATKPLRFVAVTSDTGVGRTEDSENISLVIPPTTNADMLAEAAKPVQDAITVVVSTYQSLRVVAEAQTKGLPTFRVSIADEAHRTTGVAREGEVPSEFLLFHDAGKIRAKNRLYLTATPRIFTENLQRRVQSAGYQAYSMDDVEIFGPEFFRYSFRNAVEDGYLADYRIRVVVFNESDVQRAFVEWLQEEDAPDVPRLVRVHALWKALRDPNVQPPLRRMITFVNSRRVSQEIVETWNRYIDKIGEEPKRYFVAHMDGTMPMRERSKLLRCLETLTDRNGQPVDHVVISNARVLTEGIDVPDLDAVVFLEPRKSQIDVIQAIGRVVRKPADRPDKIGTILVPVILDIEPDMPVSEGDIENLILPQEERFRPLIQIINALRALDDAADVRIRKLLQPHGSASGDDSGTSIQLELDLEMPEDLTAQVRRAITTKLVEPVQDRPYFQAFQDIVQQVAQRLRTQLDAVLEHESMDEAHQAFESYVQALRAVLHPNIPVEDAKDFLIQHWILSPVFSALFPGDDLTQAPVAKAFERMTKAFQAFLNRERATLDDFYRRIRRRAQGITTHEQRQELLRQLFEMLFRAVFPRAADRLGIVYTPVELVDFLLNSIDVVLQKHFGKTMASPGVTIIDPFAGTGTFPVRMLNRWDKDTIQRKLADREFWANDMQLFAYYLLMTNLRWTIREQTGEDPGWNLPVLWVDSFQLMEEQGTWHTTFFAEDYTTLMTMQREAPITVVMGNPPWRATQRRENEANQNLRYERLDQRIAQTYVARSTATNRNRLYDAYIRAFRWSSDRVGSHGVIAFVTNAGWIDGNAMDGLRKTLTEEFTSIYVINLRGNVRDAIRARDREGARQEGESVFPIQAGTALVVFVKDPAHTGSAEIFYHDIGDYLSRADKLARVRDFQDVRGVSWTRIVPNAAGDWINQRTDDFASLIALQDDRSSQTIKVFKIRSYGVNTARDAWAYNFSRETIAQNMQRMIAVYNSQVGKNVDEQLNDPQQISWSRGLRRDATRGIIHSFRPDAIRMALYRPFAKRWLYFDRAFNEMVYQQPCLFPRPDAENRVIVVQGLGANRTFSCFITDTLPDVQMMSNGQCFPRYVYETTEGREIQLSLEGGGALPRHDGITDEALNRFQKHYGDATITKDDLFYYVYGVLHAPDYRERFAADLRRQLPRIPFAPDFWAFSRAGRALADLHLQYESVDPYPLEEVVTRDAPDDPRMRYRVERMRLHEDRTSLVVNEWITIRGIPEEAFQYQVNGRSPIEWVVDQYRIREDRETGHVNDPNAWARETAQDPRYIVDLVKRVVRVAVETVKIVQKLPKALS